MVPAAYVRLDSWPLTPGGKLDRQALPAPEDDAYAVRAYEQPRGETETLVAELMAGVLKLDRVGRQDNFFKLGGHSLLAVTLMERMRRHGLEVDVGAVLKSATVADLAAAVGDGVRVVEVPANAIPEPAGQKKSLVRLLI